MPDSKGVPGGRSGHDSADVGRPAEWYSVWDAWEWRAGGVRHESRADPQVRLIMAANILGVRGI